MIKKNAYATPHAKLSCRVSRGSIRLSVLTSHIKIIFSFKYWNIFSLYFDRWDILIHGWCKNGPWKLSFNCLRWLWFYGVSVWGWMWNRTRLQRNKNCSCAEFYEIQFSCSSNSSKYGEIKLIIWTKSILIMVLIRLEVN